MRPMTYLGRLTGLLCVLVATVAQGASLRTISADHIVQVCTAQKGEGLPRDFSRAGCETTTLGDVDPQGMELWVRMVLPINTADENEYLTSPVGLFLFAKAASEIYLNGQLLGNNGQPGNSENENPGRMDVSVFVPDGLIRDGDNDLVLHLSSQHGFLTLYHPIHSVAIGAYRDPRAYVQQHSELGLVVLGILLVGLMYFFVRCLNPQQRRTHTLFVLLCLFAALQLCLELWRGIGGYPYPLHDARLLLVTGLSLSFGLCLLIFIGNKFAPGHALHWIYAGAGLSGVSLFLFPGFDAKTTAATFMPAAVATALVTHQWWKTRSLAAMRSALALLGFLLTILVTANYFHETVYFLLVAALICFLFVQQALDSNRQQRQHLKNQESIAKLTFRLEQGAQHQSPATLKIASAGKVDIINTANIGYCKAARDYTEIHLVDGRQHLYSGNMKSLEDQLPSTFLRVHRSYLVNLEQIKSLSSQAGAGGVLALNSDQQVPVSRRLMPAVRTAVSEEGA